MAQHPSLWERWRLPSLAAGALNWEKGLGNSATSYPAGLTAKLGAWVKQSMVQMDRRCWNSSGEQLKSGVDVVSARPREQSIGVVKWCLWKKEQGREQRNANTFLAAARNKGSLQLHCPGMGHGQRLGPSPSVLTQPPSSAFTTWKWRYKCNMKNSKEFGKSWNTAEAGVVTSPESCKDHHNHALFPPKAGGCLTTSLQQREDHASLD